MAIKEYFKLEPSGKRTRFYMVTAEAVNRYTGLRCSKKRRGVTSKPKAEKIYKEIWNLCRNEKPGVQIKTWGQLLEKYTAEIEEKVRSHENPIGLSPNVIATKISRFAHLKNWDSFHLDLIIPHFVNKELDTLEQSGVASRSLTRHILKEVKCIFSYAVGVGPIKYNPFEKCPNRRLPKKNKQALNHSEVKIFLKEAFEREHPYYFIWLLALTLGLRRSELAGLKWGDMNFEHGLINVQRQLIPGEGLVEKTKGFSDRVVAIPDFILPTLKEFQLRAKTEFVIEYDGSSWKGGAQSEVTRKFCREIGIKEVTFHQLRATHITLALIDGISIGIVKANVGHSKLSTTDGYFRSSGIEMRGKTNKLNIPVPTAGRLLKIADPEAR